MNKELEKRCNEVTKELLGSLKNLKKEKHENENEKTNKQKVYDTFSIMPKSFPNDNNG